MESISANIYLFLFKSFSRHFPRLFFRAILFFGFVYFGCFCYYTCTCSCSPHFVPSFSHSHSSFLCLFFIIIIIFACYYHLMSILCLPFRRYALRLRFSYTRNLGICFWTSVYKFFEWLTNNGYKGFNKKSLVDFSSRM